MEFVCLFMERLLSKFRLVIGFIQHLLIVTESTHSHLTPTSTLLYWSISRKFPLMTQSIMPSRLRRFSTDRTEDSYPSIPSVVACVTFVMIT
jgi:hypothetical protein